MNPLIFITFIACLSIVNPILGGPVGDKLTILADGKKIDVSMLLNKVFALSKDFYIIDIFKAIKLGLVSSDRVLNKKLVKLKAIIMDDLLILDKLTASSVGILNPDKVVVPEAVLKKIVAKALKTLGITGSLASNIINSKGKQLTFELLKKAGSIPSTVIDDAEKTIDESDLLNKISALAEDIITWQQAIEYKKVAQVVIPWIIKALNQIVKNLESLADTL